MKTIKRTIYIDNLSDLELHNTGVHFTENLSYSHVGGGSNGLTKKNSNYKVNIFVKEYTINEQATAITNENYPSEKEYVLEMNQELLATIEILPGKDFLGKWGFGRPVQRYETKINTGTRADVWVTNL